ncbi:heavy-metal-associated domain-containing protein [Oscillospiraceae bacterium MB08-C2-2]|nr:heavy-metal-associated domain-containing protein [Oscillospiraceae bacterium MB08-C2-2]
MRKVYIEGMGCQHCVDAVTAALSGLGLSDIQVNLESGFASFAGSAEDSAIQAAIEDAGYDAVSFG